MSGSYIASTLAAGAVAEPAARTRADGMSPDSARAGSAPLYRAHGAVSHYTRSEKVNGTTVLRKKRVAGSHVLAMGKVACHVFAHVGNADAIFFYI